jgi:hypothetical protein
MNFMHELNDHFENLGGVAYREVLEQQNYPLTQEMIFSITCACIASNISAKETAETLFDACKGAVETH